MPEIPDKGSTVTELDQKALEAAIVAVSAKKASLLNPSYLSMAAVAEAAIRAYLDALDTATITPAAGWKLVPVDPDGYMIRAGVDERDRPGSGGSVVKIYAAMLAAAASPPDVSISPIGEGEPVAWRVKRYGEISGGTFAWSEWVLTSVAEFGNMPKVPDHIVIEPLYTALASGHDHA